jgi:DNA-directed RNA polymerase subunit M/transcription elongation factor TFIIS
MNSIKSFDKNKSCYQIINSSSPFLQLPFITPQGKELNHNQIDDYTNQVNRNKSLRKLDSYIHNIDKSINIEAGLFEFSIVYTIIKKLNNNLMSAIYNDKLNDILMNLDSSNVLQNNYLIRQILNDNINSYEVAFLSPQEIHPDRWQLQIRKKKLREEKKNNIDATDLYECYRCHTRRCSVLQMQIRSADEPMTNIVTCLNCHNVWRC